MAYFRLKSEAFPGFGAEVSARNRRGSCNLSNIPTRVLFEREIRRASHTEAAPVEDVGELSTQVGVSQALLFVESSG